MARTSRIKVGGMSCAICAKTLEKALGRLQGVEKAVVNLSDSSVRVVVEESVKLEDIIMAIEESGYTYFGLIEQYGEL